MRRGVFLAAALLALGACGNGGGNPAQSPVPNARPSSPAVVGIDQPRNADNVKGPNVKLVLRVENATLVPESTTTVRPGEGHLRVTLDNGSPVPGQLTMTIPGVAAGEHVIRVEFVAADNLPFDPRVQSAVIFNVT